MTAGREWELDKAPMPQMFGNADREHMEKYGSTPDHYAWIGWKNHKHSVNNPTRSSRPSTRSTTSRTPR